MGLNLSEGASFPTANFWIVVLFFGLDHATASRVLAPQGGIDHRCGAAHARVDPKGMGRAVLGASSALHAGIAILDPNPSVIRAQDCMRTYHEAHPAPDAFLLIKLERGHTFQIDHWDHLLNSSGQKTGAGPENDA